MTLLQGSPRVLAQDRLQREQVEMTAKMQAELRKEREGPLTQGAAVTSTDPVADAWRKAQEEAEAAKRNNRRGQHLREQNSVAAEQAHPEPPRREPSHSGAASVPHCERRPSPPMSPMVNARIGQGKGQDREAERSGLEVMGPALRPAQGHHLIVSASQCARRSTRSWTLCVTSWQRRRACA